VSAVVDGVPIRAEMNVQAYWFQGLLDGWLELQGATEDRVFYVVLLNALSDDACSYLVFAPLPFEPFTAAGSYVEGGSCDVTVTATAPAVGDIIEGTFSAVVGPLGASPLLALTDGRFRAPRTPDNGPPRP
jgi:hypothetical protein